MGNSLTRFDAFQRKGIHVETLLKSFYSAEKEVNHGNNISDRLKQSLCRFGTATMVLVGLVVQSISHMTISTKVQKARGEINGFLSPQRNLWTEATK